MSEYPKAKMPEYGDGPEPCEDCAIKDKRIAELEVTAAWVDEADSLVRRMSRYILDVLRGDDNSMVGAQIRTATNPILCDARDFMNRTRPPKPGQSEGGADECKWVEDKTDRCLWNSSCGWVFRLDTDDPPDIGWKYCPRCGKPIRTAEGGADD